MKRRRVRRTGSVVAAVVLASVLAACAPGLFNRGPELAPAGLPSYELGDTFVFDDGSTTFVSVVWPDGKVTWTTGARQTRIAVPNVVMPPLQWVKGTRSGGFEADADPDALWPLAVGNSTTFRGRAHSLDKRDGSEKSIDRRYNCAVTGTKAVTVAAGTFDTFKVRCVRRSRRTNGRTSTRVYLWYYAPAVGHYVLHKIERRGRKLRQVELASVRRAYGGLADGQRAAIDHLRSTALATRRSGESEVWSDPDGTVVAEVSLLTTFQTEAGTYCRRYLETVQVGGVATSAPGIACKRAGGDWERL